MSFHSSEKQIETWLSLTLAFSLSAIVHLLEVLVSTRGLREDVPVKLGRIVCQQNVIGPLDGGFHAVPKIDKAGEATNGRERPAALDIRRKVFANKEQIARQDTGAGLGLHRDGLMTRAMPRRRKDADARTISSSPVVKSNLHPCQGGSSPQLGCSYVVQ